MTSMFLARRRATSRSASICCPSYQIPHQFHELLLGQFTKLRSQFAHWDFGQLGPSSQSGDVRLYLRFECRGEIYLYVPTKDVEDRPTWKRMPLHHSSTYHTFEIVNHRS